MCKKLGKMTDYECLFNLLLCVCGGGVNKTIYKGHLNKLVS